MIHDKDTNMTLTATPIHSFLTTGGQDIDLFPVSPVPSEVTIAEAAALLDVPEAFVDEMLKINAVEYRQDGEQSLIDRDKLLEYKQRRDYKRVGLVEMCRMSQEMGLYDV
jgi:excisionase family DNA binding protein